MPNIIPKAKYIIAKADTQLGKHAIKSIIEKPL